MLQTWESIFAKPRVGFGRTDLSLSAIGTTFCALSSGHALPEILCLKGLATPWIFMTCLGVRNANKNEHAG